MTPMLSTSVTSFSQCQSAGFQRGTRNKRRKHHSGLAMPIMASSDSASQTPVGVLVAAVVICDAGIRDQANSNAASPV